MSSRLQPKRTLTQPYGGPPITHGVKIQILMSYEGFASSFMWVLFSKFSPHTAGPCLRMLAHDLSPADLPPHYMFVCHLTVWMLRLPVYKWSSLKDHRLQGGGAGHLGHISGTGMGSVPATNLDTLVFSGRSEVGR